jgi:hypothetical protein
MMDGAKGTDEAAKDPSQEKGHEKYTETPQEPFDEFVT